MLKRLATVVFTHSSVGKGRSKGCYFSNGKTRYKKLSGFSLWPSCLKCHFLVPGISQNDGQNADDERALPPAYLSVPNFKDCMGSEMLGGSSHVCLLLERPQNCPQDSFERLRQLGKVILSCRDTHQNQPSKKYKCHLSSTFLPYFNL